MAHFVVLCTAPPKVAKQLAKTLVRERLAACVNLVGPVSSVYRWEDKLCEDRETLCVLKTSAARYPKLEARIRAIHPYAVPEVLALPVRAGSPPYLRWLAASVSSR